MFLNENNIDVGMILQNGTCYMRVGKIIDNTVYVEKLLIENDKLVWSQINKQDLIAQKVTILNKVPTRTEKIDEEIPLYMSKSKYDQFVSNNLENITMSIGKNKNVFREAVQLTLFKFNIVREFEYSWQTGKWECTLSN